MKIPTADKELLKNNDIRNYYLLGLVLTIGITVEGLEKMLLPVCHKARWFTFNISLFRAFLQEENPSEEFIKMVQIALWHLCMCIRVKMAPLIQGNMPKIS